MDKLLSLYWNLKHTCEHTIYTKLQLQQTILSWRKNMHENMLPKNVSRAEHRHFKFEILQPGINGSKKVYCSMNLLKQKQYKIVIDLHAYGLLSKFSSPLCFPQWIYLIKEIKNHITPPVPVLEALTQDSVWQHQWILQYSSRIPLKPWTYTRKAF